MNGRRAKSVRSLEYLAVTLLPTEITRAGPVDGGNELPDPPIIHRTDESSRDPSQRMDDFRGTHTPLVQSVTPRRYTRRMRRKCPTKDGDETEITGRKTDQSTKHPSTRTVVALTYHFA
jgi:hypothetical protein